MRMVQVGISESQNEVTEVIPQMKQMLFGSLSSIYTFENKFLLESAFLYGGLITCLPC